MSRRKTYAQTIDEEKEKVEMPKWVTVSTQLQSHTWWVPFIGKPMERTGVMILVAVGPENWREKEVKGVHVGVFGGKLKRSSRPVH
ncbi:hypothetical protein M5689_006483 [Euphorbia peplus]|nr:hypothetical protein M5689_006483 [Euphorbia peplus]